MKKQNIFKFNFAEGDDSDNFYLNTTNQEAYNNIIKSNHNCIYLKGPRKSGKSLLGKIWLNKNDALKYDNNFKLILKVKRNIVVDNLDYKINEEEIFHIINHCKFYNLKILVISNYSVNELNFDLKDIISRLRAFIYCKINLPDDDMLLNILTKLFIDKQFIINSHDIFDFILKRANRSYSEMINIVEKLDTLSIERKRQLTIPLIKEIL